MSGSGGCHALAYVRLFPFPFFRLSEPSPNQPSNQRTSDKTGDTGNLEARNTKPETKNQRMNEGRKEGRKEGEGKEGSRGAASFLPKVILCVRMGV